MSASNTRKVDAGAAHQSSTGGPVADFEGPAEALLAYVGAFEARDADFIAAAVGDTSLIEIPMLKPNRLFGKEEILSAHRESFNTIDSAKFDLAKPAEKGSVAIAHGVLTVRRADGRQDEHSLGIVAETDGGKLRRLALYLNARNHRLWSDKIIL